MRIYELVHEIVMKFVPMDKLSSTDLQTETLRWYKNETDDLARYKAEVAEAADYNTRHKDDDDFVPRVSRKETLKNKVFRFLESPVARYAFAILFIFLVPKVKAIINGVTTPPEPDEDPEDDPDDYEDFIAWRRHRKEMR